MSSRIRRNILIFTIWYIRIRFSEITTRLRRIFRWGKIDRRKQLLLPSAPDLPYNKALPELYDSAKSPEKPSVTRVSCPNGVKKSLPALYPKLVGMVAHPAGFEPTACRLGGGRSILLSYGCTGRGSRRAGEEPGSRRKRQQNNSFIMP